MKVHIKMVVESQHDNAMVSFSSALGDATVRWAGLPPKIGEDYEAEIEVPGILKWGSEITETQMLTDLIFEEGGQVCIVGQLKSIDRIGVATVQLLNDVILLETIGYPTQIPSHVLIKTSSLTLFLVNL